MKVNDFKEKLTYRQYKVLELLAEENRPMPLSEIGAKKIYSSSSNTYNFAIKTLMELKLVRRVVKGTYAITEFGREIYKLLKDKLDNGGDK